jgi:hypothetical protein
MTTANLDLSPQDRDLMIRTVIGEADGDPSAPAVAHVILNRMRNNGQSARRIILAKGQFEPWSTRPAELLSYDSTDPEYKRAANIVDGVISGKIADPTNGATNFYAPAAQKALGRTAPRWDDGTGQQIGGHLFFGGKQTPLSDDEINASWGGPGSAGAKPLSNDEISASWEGPKGASRGKEPVPDYLSASWEAEPSTKKHGAPAAQSSIPDYLSASWGHEPQETQQPAPSPTRAAHPEMFAPQPKNWQPVPPEKTGAMGLVWDNDGGRDPQTGELVVGGKEPAQDHAQLLAGASGVLNGVPIAGPSLLSGVQNVAAARNALATNTPMADNLAAVRSATESANAAYPKTALAGNVGGALVGTIPAMAAAPGAFGVGGAPLPLRMLASALTGGAIQGADTGVRSGDWRVGYDPQGTLGLTPIERGAALGAGLGFVAPAAGAAVGSAVKGGVNALSRTTPEARNVAGVLSDINMTPDAARNALTRMGPNATLADIDPALTTEAGALASMGGAPTSILKGAMARRAAGADDRVAQAVETMLGPRPDITAAKEAVYNTAQTAAAPYYNAARAQGGSADVTPILRDIEGQLKNAVGGEAAILNKAKNYLSGGKIEIPGPDGKPVSMTVAKDDPSALLKVRQALDGDIESLQRNGTIDGTSAGKSALRAASDIRGQIDDVLKDNTHIAAGDQAFSEQMRLKDAIDEGSQLFTKGTRLPDFKRSLAAKSPEEVAALRQGALSSVWDALDNARRGTLSGAQSMFGKSTANRAKLEALFPNSDEALDMLHGEASMRGAEQRVAQNSATAERLAAQRKYSPQADQGIGAAAPILGEAIGGGPGAAALTTGRMLYGSIKEQLTRNALARLSEGTARGLAATGPAQQDFLGQLSRAYATNALSRGASSGGDALTNLLMRSAGPQGYNALMGR